MEAPSDPVKHRGAPGWFPAEERDWLFQQAESEEFKNACRASQGGDNAPWELLKERLKQAFDVRYGAKMEGIMAEVSARQKVADEENRMDSGIAQLRKSYPYGYVGKLATFWLNRKHLFFKSQSIVSAKGKGKEKSPARIRLPLPRSPRKIYHDTHRKLTSDAINDLRKDKGIPFQKHLSMLTTDLNNAYNNASDEVRRECERIAQEERDLFVKDQDAIYEAQEHVQEYVGRVITGLIGKEHGQVGNMWFHGIGAYRDKTETLKFFSVESGFEEGSSDHQAFSRQPFYHEFFQRVQRFAEDRVRPNNAPDKSSMVLPSYDFELVSPSQQRDWLLAHIEGHYEEMFRQDLPVPWDAIAANPDHYLIAPPTTFTFGNPLELPLAALPSIAEYFWSNPSFFKVPQADPMSDEEAPIPQASQSLPEDGVDAGASIPAGSEGLGEPDSSVPPRKRRKVGRKGGPVAVPSSLEPIPIAPVQSRAQGSATRSGSGRKLRSDTAGAEVFVKQRTVLASGPAPPGRPGYDYVAEDVTPPASVNATPSAIVNDEVGEEPSVSTSVPAVKKGSNAGKRGANGKKPGAATSVPAVKKSGNTTKRGVKNKKTG
ncbi:hypothetical protein PQX77_002441 [Marasmius sp. AFHP31]|nr:hypothetical protein PQX77_002441 [Marasmius sp. AFHP31]